jgi:2-polyprenyl-6-methoxyphenol hydroxylase-like FAD-dependent oxidoreductase
VHIGGRYGYCVDRSRMIDVLTDRVLELGGRVEYERSVTDPAELDADLVVAADGVNSRLRATAFQPTVTTGRNNYVWLGTPKMFDAFTFAFERTDAGWIWAYGYPSSGATSTFIVECAPPTWEGLGLGADDGLPRLADIFADVLSGEPLLGPASWLRFKEIRNATWRAGNLVLAGDAAHTTHFGIGSGTVLAVQDAVRLAESLRLFADDLPGAVAGYDALRRAEVGRVQEQALRNMHWFEEVGRYLDTQDPVRFAYTLLDRRGDHPEAWRYQLHKATQVDGLRTVRKGVTTVRRTVRAVKRGERVGR